MPTPQELLKLYQAGGSKPLTKEQILGVPNVITSSDLNSVSYPTIPPQIPDTTPYAGISEGAEAYMTASTPPKIETPYSDTANSLLQSIQDLSGQTNGETSYRQQQLEASGAIALEGKQRELQARMEALNLESQAKSLSEENRQATKSFVQVEQQQIERSRAIKALTIQSEYALNAGQLQTAKETAQRAVDLKYKDIEKKIESNTKLLQLYAPFMTAEQKKIADAQEKVNIKKEKEWADKQKLQMDVLNLAQENKDSVTASRILGLNPESPTFTQELQAEQAKMVAKQAPYITDENGQTVQYLKDASGAIIPSSRTVLGGKASGGSGVSLNTTNTNEDENLYQQLKNRSIQFSNLGTKAERDRALAIFAAKGETIPRVLTAKEKAATADATSGLDAVNTLRNMASNGALPLARDYIFGDTAAGRFLGTSQFLNAVKEAADIKTRIRTGAALNESEIVFYASQTPKFGDSPEDIQSKLNQLEGFYLGMSGLPVAITNPKTGEVFEFDDLFNNKQRLGLREAIKQGFTLSY